MKFITELSGISSFPHFLRSVTTSPLHTFLTIDSIKNGSEQSEQRRRCQLFLHRSAPDRKDLDMRMCDYTSTEWSPIFKPISASFYSSSAEPSRRATLATYRIPEDTDNAPVKCQSRKGVCVDVLHPPPPPLILMPV